MPSTSHLHRLSALCGAYGDLLVAALACVPFLNILHNPLLYDDVRAVLKNPDARWDSPLSALMKNDFWGTPLSSPASHKSFRPLTTFTFRLNHLLDPSLAPEGFHAVNIVLHVMVTLLVLKTCRALLSHTHKGLLSFIAGALFATHPIHTDAVDNAVGRAELLCALFFLLGTLAYSRVLPLRESSPRGILGFLYILAALLCQVLATLSKEPGILLGPLCICLEVLQALFTSDSGKSGPRKRQHPSNDLLNVRVGLLVLGTAALAKWRYDMNGHTPPHFEENDITISPKSDVLTRVLSLTYLSSVHAGLLLWPANLSHDWSRSSVTPITSLLDIRNTKTVSLYALLFALGLYGLGFLRVRRTSESDNTSRRRSDRQHSVLLALLLLVVPFLLSSNLLVRVGFTISERALYLPSLGFCLLAALVLVEAARWLEEEANESSRSTAPGQASEAQSPKKQTKSQKLDLYATITLILLTSAVLGLYVWRTVERNKDWRSEEALALSSLRHLPANAKVNMQLANALIRKNRLDEAEFFCRSMISLFPDFYLARFNLHSILFARKDWSGAQHELLEGLKLSPKFVDKDFLVKRMVEKLSELGREAPVRFLRRLREIVRPDQDQLPGYLLVNAYMEQKNFDDARYILENEILAATPRSALALNTLGFLFLSMGNWTAAREPLERAVSINGTDAGVLQNLAVAQFMSQDFAAAEATLVRCLAVNSRNTQALTLLGKILRARGLDKEAVGRRVNEYVDQHPDIRAEMDVAWAILWSDVSEPNQ